MKLLKKIQTFKNDYEFYLVEWDNITGGVLVVQRNKIEELLNDKFFSLGEDKNDIFDIIKNIKPYAIHFEEIPETFVSESILNKIYSNDREYFIISTTHSSYTNPSTIKYTADKYVLVSEWSKKIFLNYFLEKNRFI